MSSELLGRIELYLTRTGISETRFGRTVVHDPRFVGDLRAGRSPRRRVRTTVEDYLASVEA